MTTTKEPINETEAYQRHERILANLEDAIARRRDARTEARIPINHATTAEEAERHQAAYDAVLADKAAERIGEGTHEAVQAAEARLRELEQTRSKARQEAREAVRLAELEVGMLKEKLAEARAELDREAAERMRPTVTKWLETLADFLRANEALHAAELAISTAGVKPPVTATRDLILTTGEGSQSRLAWLLAGKAWTSNYTAELAEHKNLTTSPLLARDRADLTDQERRLKARTEAARQRTNPDTTPPKPRKPRLFAFTSRPKARA